MKNYRAFAYVSLSWPNDDVPNTAAVVGVNILRERPVPSDFNGSVYTGPACSMGGSTWGDQGGAKDVMDRLANEVAGKVKDAVRLRLRWVDEDGVVYKETVHHGAPELAQETDLPF